MEALLAALSEVRFWAGEELGFALGGGGAFVSLVGLADGLPVADPGRFPRLFGVPAPPDGLYVPWAYELGVLGQGPKSRVMVAAARLPVFLDTRERRAGGAEALFRFARCGQAGHAGRGGYCVLCPGCLTPIREAHAQGVEASRAREAVRALREAAARDARGGPR